MAIDRMEKQPKFSHSYFHDLESVFYVMCWTCTLYTGPRSMKRQFSSPELSYLDTAVAKWNGDVGDNTIGMLLSTKGFSVFGSRLDTTIGQFAPYFDNIKNFAMRFGELIFNHLRLRSLELEELAEKKKDVDTRFKTSSPDDKKRMKSEYDIFPIQMRPPSVSLDAVLAVVDRTLSSMAEEDNDVEEVNGPDDVQPRRVRGLNNSTNDVPRVDYLPDNSGEAVPPIGGASALMESMTRSSSAPSKKRKASTESAGSYSSKRGRFMASASGTSRSEVVNNNEGHPSEVLKIRPRKSPNSKVANPRIAAP